MSWPAYLVLHALFGSRIPGGYTSAIRNKYQKTNAKDYSEEYGKAQQEAGRLVTLYRIDDAGQHVSVYYREKPLKTSAVNLKQVVHVD
ncbi:hypothetical protein THARTR1_09810 [Trichoderma harzianum]|uniref:Uncharacterized protein n=1 Tax=Trichoderma harzianum TaxID=5544 RepID=A0A2K0TVD2_TRIHA|nr:hypothetical protein THARTR1_09810 [Trichoderma harzianum]